MTLDQWLALARHTETSFAALIGSTQAAVNRYRRGKRIPQPEVMARIVKETGGLVTPNDFYGCTLEVKALEPKSAAPQPR